MKIKKIKIKNFKSIVDITIECNPLFNVIIGQNNIGKTTILEAVLLWKKCFDKNIQRKGRKFYSNVKNIHFQELSFLRITDDTDLFNTINNKKADIEVELEFDDEGDIYNLGFRLTKVYNIDNAYFQLHYIEKNEFIRFETVSDKYNKKIKNIIVISESKPIANIITKEPYMYKAQIVSKLSKGKGFEVLSKALCYAKSPMGTDPKQF
ncbi:MAG TPA: ATP-binding protein [Epulopiscium sp.]|nr:ATP-binding protein [Candidatus Epulonipiscium sp.]